VSAASNSSAGKPGSAETSVVTCAESIERSVLDVSALFSQVLADQALPLHLRERILGVAASFQKAPGQASELRRAAAAVVKEISLQAEQRKSVLKLQRQAQLKAKEAERTASTMEKKADEAQKRVDELMATLQGKLDSKQMAQQIVAEEVRKVEWKAEEKIENLRKELMQKDADLELSLLRTSQLEMEMETLRRENEQFRSCIPTGPQTPPPFSMGDDPRSWDDPGLSASQVGRSPYLAPDPLQNQKGLHHLLAGSERNSDGGSLRLGRESNRKRSARRSGTAAGSEYAAPADRDSSGNAVVTRFIVLSIACVSSYFYGRRHGRNAASA